MANKSNLNFYILEEWYRIDSGRSARLGCLELEGGVFACPIPHSDRFPQSSGPASSAAKDPRGCQLHRAQYRPHSLWHQMSTGGGGGCHSSPGLPSWVHTSELDITLVDGLLQHEPLANVGWDFFIHYPKEIFLIIFTGMDIWVTSGFHTRTPKGQMVLMSQFSPFLLSTCGTLLQPTHLPLPLV